MTAYLTDSRDRIVFGETPMLMQPVFGEALAPPDLGKHRFLSGRDGLYIEARNPVIEIRLKIADASLQLPYGTVENTGVHLRQGEIPAELLNRAINQAKSAVPKEWAGYIVWDGQRKRYDLFEPPIIAASPIRVSYTNVLPEHLEVVIDVHSHGTLPAFFSDDDDLSDRSGFYIAVVFGHCQQETPTLVSRLVVNGHFLPITNFTQFFGETHA